MLNYYQQDAFGNALTVLTNRYGDRFKGNLWELFSNYNPHKDFSISGSKYYIALNSIPNKIKQDIVLKIISTFNFHKYSPNEVFATLAYLNLCDTYGYFLMNFIINAISVFDSDDGYPTVSVYSVENDEIYEYDIKCIFNINQPMSDLSFTRFGDEIHISINFAMLKNKFSLFEGLDDAVIRRISTKLIEQDMIKVNHCHWIYSNINYIEYNYNRIFNELSFIVKNLQFLNNNGLY